MKAASPAGKCARATVFFLFGGGEGGGRCTLEFSRDRSSAVVLSLSMESEQADAGRDG